MQQLEGAERFQPTAECQRYDSPLGRLLQVMSMLSESEYRGGRLHGDASCRGKQLLRSCCQTSRQSILRVHCHRR